MSPNINEAENGSCLAVCRLCRLPLPGRTISSTSPPGIILPQTCFLVNCQHLLQIVILGVTVQKKHQEERIFWSLLLQKKLDQKIQLGFHVFLLLQIPLNVVSMWYPNQTETLPCKVLSGRRVMWRRPHLSWFLICREPTRNKAW